jgi:hypothetical protein
VVISTRGASHDAPTERTGRIGTRNLSTINTLVVNLTLLLPDGGSATLVDDTSGSSEREPDDNGIVNASSRCHASRRRSC